MLNSFAPFPMIEQMLTIDPDPRASMCLPTSRRYMNAPLRSTERIQFHVAMSNCSGAIPRMSATPALLTSTSIAPWASMAAATTRATSSSTETSPTTVVTFTP